MSLENATQPTATPSEPAASPERAGADAPVDGGQPNGEGQAQPTDGTQQPAEANADAGGEQPPKPTPEHRTVQGRISEYQKRARQAELDAAEERGRRLALEEQLRTGVKPQEVTPSAPAKPAGPPDPKDASKYPQGEFDPRYTVDLAKYELREEQRVEAETKTAAERQAAATAAREAGRERLIKTFEAAEAEADGPNGRFFENAPIVLDQAARTLPPAYVDLITEADNPVHVAELIGRGGLKNLPIDLASLKAMPLAQAQRAISKLDAFVALRLAEQTGAHPAPTPTPAPQPSTTPSPVPTPVVPNSGGFVFNPESATPEQWQEYYRRSASSRAPR